MSHKISFFLKKKHKLGLFKLTLEILKIKL